jgi:hypothetical protein
MKKTGIIIVGIALFVVMVFFALSILNQQKEEYPFPGKQPNTSSGTARNSNIQPPPGKHPLAERYGKEGQKPGMSIEDRLVKELKEYYGSTISKKSTQAILLKVRDYIYSLFPEDGEARFYNILKRAFPDLADEIIATLEKLDEYNRWEKENNVLLSEMNELERKGTIWEKRKEIFGDEAEEIWSDEIFAYEERKQNMKETIRLLDESYDTTIDEKLDIYISALHETYENSPEAYFLENKGLLAKVFFGIDSVQKELKQMNADRRQTEINEIRREMGFTQEQIERHEEIDAYRNSRWEKGLKYMEERDAITKEFEGPELEEKLKTLREKYFKHEAKTIELEENDNFFRYKRPRVYGRN